MRKSIRINDRDKNFFFPSRLSQPIAAAALVKTSLGGGHAARSLTISLFQPWQLILLFSPSVFLFVPLSRPGPLLRPCAAAGTHAGASPLLSRPPPLLEAV